jgi:DNA-binding SARP family transcriptional activator
VPRVLLLEAGHPVRTERLIDLLWDGGAPPDSARATVHTYVGRLRRAGLLIVTQHDGYLIEAFCSAATCAERGIRS